MNLLDIYFEDYNSFGIMAAKMWIRDGSRCDPKGQKGAHQLLGSLLNRGCGPYDYHKVGDLIEGCGASLNCETYEDGLLISLKCMEQDAYQLTPLIGWMIEEPHLKASQIALEKELSIQALIRQNENPFYVAFDSWRRIAFSAGPYEHDPLGSIKDLETIGKNELQAISKKLSLRKKVLVFSGSYPKKLIEDITQMKPFNLLNNYKIENSTKPSFLPHNHSKRECSINIEFKETNQVVLMLGQPTTSYCHKDDLCLRLLSCHLGVGMSSELFLELREKYGVAYDVGVHHPIRETDCPFIVHASTSEEKSGLTLKLLQKVLNDIKKHPLTTEQLSLAKVKYKSLIAHSTQTVSQCAERKAHLLGLGLASDQDKFNLKKIESITSDELIAAATKYLSSPILSLCGPKRSVKKLADQWLN